MRICLWHGWLLEGTGSNVYTARTAEAMRAAGHDVLILCQDLHPDRYGFLDAHGSVGSEVSELVSTGTQPGPGRATALRPEIGKLLPVFVYDEYEGFEVKRFVDLSDEELDRYMQANVEAVRAAVAWHGSDILVTGHVVPGAAIGRRSMGEGGYVAKIHGSDLEYAIKLDERYARMALEGLEGARGIVGSSEDVLQRTLEFVPSVRDRMRIAYPGVDTQLFHPRPRRQALEEVASLLATDERTAKGRSDATVRALSEAVAARDTDALDTLATHYDQTAPDAGAAGVIAALALQEGPLVGYLGKIIPQKGVERMVEAVATLGIPGVIVGFGTYREWLEALVETLDGPDTDGYSWLRRTSEMKLELDPSSIDSTALRSRVRFTGRLDHRYAPGILSALDVLVVPSTLAEAFGMVAAEGAAAGAFPLVARHSGLAEVADALEQEVGKHGLFSFEPGEGATDRIVAGLRTLLEIGGEERDELRSAISGFVAREWSWEATSRRILEAAGLSL